MALACGGKITILEIDIILAYPTVSILASFLFLLRMEPEARERFLRPSKSGTIFPRTSYMTPIAMRIVGSLGVLGSHNFRVPVYKFSGKQLEQDVFGSKMRSALVSSVVISCCITHWRSFQHKDNKRGHTFLRKPTSTTLVQCIEALKLLNDVLSKPPIRLWYPGRWQGWCVKWCYLQHGSGVSMTESNELYFSLTWFSSTNRHPLATRISTQLGLIVSNASNLGIIDVQHEHSKCLNVWTSICLISRKLKSGQRKRCWSRCWLLLQPIWVFGIKPEKLLLSLEGSQLHFA